MAGFSHSGVLTRLTIALLAGLLVFVLVTPLTCTVIGMLAAMSVGLTIWSLVDEVALHWRH